MLRFAHVAGGNGLKGGIPGSRRGGPGFAVSFIAETMLDPPLGAFLVRGKGSRNLCRCRGHVVQVNWVELHDRVSRNLSDGCKDVNLRRRRSEYVCPHSSQEKSAATCGIGSAKDREAGCIVRTRTWKIADYG